MPITASFHAFLDSNPCDEYLIIFLRYYDYITDQEVKEYTLNGIPELDFPDAQLSMMRNLPAEQLLIGLKAFVEHDYLWKQLVDWMISPYLVKLPELKIFSDKHDPRTSAFKVYNIIRNYLGHTANTTSRVEIENNFDKIIIERVYRIIDEGAF